MREAEGLQLYSSGGQLALSDQSGICNCRQMVFSVTASNQSLKIKVLIHKKNENYVINDSPSCHSKPKKQLSFFLPVKNYY